jgi:hypothetical protein
MIWSSLARNRSASHVASCFFGRIVSSNEAIEPQLAGRGNPKAKSQASGASDRQSLQSTTAYCAENRFLFNRLAVVHGRRTISVPNEVLGRLIPGESLGDLAGDPVGRWIGADVDPNQVASLKADDRQAIEKLEVDGRHDKHIDGGDVLGVIAEKGLPAL